MPVIGIGGISSNLIPVFLFDGSGNPLIGPVSFASGELLVSLDSADFINAAGAIQEIGGDGQGRGMFVYGVTADEYSHSALTFSVKKTGVMPFFFESLLPFPPELYQDETEAGRRSVIVFVENSSGVGQTGKSKTDVNLAVSTNRSAWAPAAGTWAAVSGVDGAYRYTFTDDELKQGLLLIILGGGVTGVRLLVLGLFIGPEQATTDVTTPTPVEVPVTYADPLYFDVFKQARNRLPQQQRSGVQIASEQSVVALGVDV